MRIITKSIILRVASRILIGVSVLTQAVVSHAATIIGNSDLLTASHANQLESWLGEGPIALTNIYTKQSGDTSEIDFHPAVDGYSRTFFIVEASQLGRPISLIGGYNPQSWGLPSGYQMTPDAADMNAFIFNLSSGVLLEQTHQAQTAVAPSIGPTMGQGHDIFIRGDLNAGYAFSYSYCPEGTLKNTICNNNDGYLNILGLPYEGNTAVSYSRLEVFSISNVPIPSAAVLFSFGLLALLRVARRNMQGI